MHTSCLRKYKTHTASCFHTYTIRWDVKECSPVEVKHHFRRTSAGSSQMLVDFYWAAHSEDRTDHRHHIHQCENLTSVFNFWLKLFWLLPHFSPCCHASVSSGNTNGFELYHWLFRTQHLTSCISHTNQVNCSANRLYLFSIDQPAIRENNRSLGLLMLYVWRKQDKYNSLPCCTAITSFISYLHILSHFSLHLHTQNIFPQV